MKPSTNKYSSTLSIMHYALSIKLCTSCLASSSLRPLLYGYASKESEL